jgi:hypothetical protein
MDGSYRKMLNWELDVRGGGLSFDYSRFYMNMSFDGFKDFLSPISEGRACFENLTSERKNMNLPVRCTVL